MIPKKQKKCLSEENSNSNINLRNIFYILYEDITYFEFYFFPTTEWEIHMKLCVYYHHWLWIKTLRDLSVLSHDTYMGFDENTTTTKV